MNWNLLDRVLESEKARTVYLYGPPGLGKTYSAFHYGRIQRGVFSVTLTEDTPAAELRGHYLPQGSEMVWKHGPLVLAMLQGARLVINEVTHASPEAMSFLHPVLESLDTAMLTLPTNENIKPADGFHVICTDNQPPDQLPFALRDRFDCKFNINKPHPKALEALEEPYRSAAEKSFQLEESRRISLRGWFALQALAKELGLQEACEAIFEEKGEQIHEAIALASA